MDVLFDTVSKTRDTLLNELKVVYHRWGNKALKRVIAQLYFACQYRFRTARNEAKEVVDSAIGFLETHEEDDVFLWAHFMDLHRPYSPDPEADFDVWQLAKVTQPDYTNPTEQEQEFISHIYSHCLRNVDEQIGRLYDYLTRYTTDDILLVVTSDHGEEFGDHGDWFHRNFKLYDELIHIPLLFAGSSVAPGRSDDLVSLIDVAPTLVEYAGVPRPESFTGISKSPTLLGGTSEKRPVVGSEVFGPHRQKVAIRSTDWKYVSDFGTGERKLYNVCDDPGEQNNLMPTMEVPESIRSKMSQYERQMGGSSRNRVDSGVEGRLGDLGYL